MIYKIIFNYKDPITGIEYNLTGIKDGQTPEEANYYFKRQYPRHNINILSTTPIL